MKSIKYWQNRYNTKTLKGASGAGSVGDLLKFKVELINDFIQKYGIKTVLDFGHGDLSLAKEIKADYTGIDIFDAVDESLTLINSKFDEYDGPSCDMAMCIDVLYHILEDEQGYMRATLDKLYDKATKLIIIYAQDSYKSFPAAYHIYNSEWRQYLETKYEEDIKLVYEQKESRPGSNAKFYVYEKVVK